MIRREHSLTWPMDLQPSGEPLLPLTSYITRCVIETDRDPTQYDKIGPFDASLLSRLLLHSGQTRLTITGVRSGTEDRIRLLCPQASHSLCQALSTRNSGSACTSTTDRNDTVSFRLSLVYSVFQKQTGSRHCRPCGATSRCTACSTKTSVTFAPTRN